MKLKLIRITPDDLQKRFDEYWKLGYEKGKAEGIKQTTINERGMHIAKMTELLRTASSFQEGITKLVMSMNHDL